MDRSAIEYLGYHGFDADIQLLADNGLVHAYLIRGNVLEGRAPLPNYELDS